MNKLIGGALSTMCLLSISLVGNAQTPAGLPDGVCVQVGYADGLRSGPGVGFFPSVWNGDAGVTFFGNSGAYDAGAVRIVNGSASPITLLPGFHVDGFQNGADFQLWDGLIGAGTTIAPGNSLILTQVNGFDFDSSDQPIQAATTKNHGSSAIPVVHAAFSGVNGNAPLSFADTDQVLNTLGYDLATGYVLPNGTVITNESFDWRCAGSGIVGPGVPEPGSVALVIGAAISGMGLVARKRRSK